MNTRHPSPAGMGGRGILVVVIGLLLGLLILKNGFSSASTASSSSKPPATTHPATTVKPTTVAPTTTTTVDKTKFTVVVANASGIAGAAGRLTDKMKADGYVMANPVTAKSQTAQTVVYFVSGYDAQGADVASYLNVGAAQPMPNPPPIDIGQAQVLVLEAKDIASSASTPTSTTAKSTTSSTG